MPSTKSSALSVVVYAKDVLLVSRFYEEVLQLEVGETDQTYSLLLGDGIELAVVQIPAFIAEGIVIASPPEARESTPVKASFLVQGFEDLRRLIDRHGGTLISEEEAWHWRGHAHLDGTDPEGNVVQFRQRV